MVKEKGPNAGQMEEDDLFLLEETDEEVADKDSLS